MQAIQLIFGVNRDEKTGSPSWEAGGLVKWAKSIGAPKMLDIVDEPAFESTIANYIKGTRNGEVAIQKFLSAHKSDGIAQYINTVRDGVYVYEDYAASAERANEATQKISLSTRAATIGMKALSMVGQMAAMWAAVTAIQKTVEFVVYKINETANRRTALVDMRSDVESLKDELEQLNGELKTTNERISELRGKGTLLTIAEGGELTTLKETSKQLQLQISLLETRARLASEKLLREETNFFVDTYSLGDSKRYTPDEVDKASLIGNSTGLMKQLLRYDDVIETLAEYDQSISEHTADLQQAMSDGDESKIEMYGQWLQNARDSRAETELLLEGVKDELGVSIEDLLKFTKALRDIKDPTAAQKELLASADSALDAAQMRFDPSAYYERRFSDIFDSKDFADQKKKLTELAKAGELTANTFSQPMFTSFVTAMGAVGISIEQIIAQLTALRGQADADFVVQNSPESFADGLTKLQEKLDLLKSAQEESAESGSISYETYQKLAEAGSEYAAVIDEVNGKLVINADRARELEDAKLTKIKDDAESALEPKQAEYDDVTKQIDDMQASYMRMWETATDKSYLDAQKAQIDALKAKQAQIAAEVDGYKAVVGQINAATSAYQRYLKAKNAPEPGDKYDQFKQAKKDIKDALSSGKVGTDTFTDAVEMMLGEGALKGKTTKEKKALGKEAKDKYDRYFTDSEKGAQNYVNDLVKKGLATKDGNRVELNEGVKAEDLAREFGVSVDAIEAMFGELEEYDWDVNWEGLFPPGTAAYERGKKDRNDYENGWNDGASDASTGPLNPSQRKHSPSKTGVEPMPADQPQTQGPPKPDAEGIKSQIDGLKSELFGLVGAYNRLSGLDVTVTFTPETAAADITAIREALLHLSQSDNTVTGSVEFTGADDANASLALYTSHLDTLAQNYKDGKIPTTVFFSMAADFQAKIESAKKYLSSIPETIDTTATVDAEPGETLTVSDLVKDAEDGKVQIDVIPNIKEPVGYVPENDYGGNPPPGSGLPSDTEGFSGYTPPASEETVTVNTEAGETVEPGDLVQGVDSNWNARIQAHSGVTRKLTPDDLVSGLVNGELPIKVKPEVSGQVTIPGANAPTTGPAKAAGTRRAKKGMALVDDGAGGLAGSELVVHHKQGTYEVGDGSAPRVTFLDDGDTVYNARETRKIFKRAAPLGGTFAGAAFASGTSGDIPGGVGGGKTPGKTNSKKSGNGWKKYVKDLFDWIEIRIAALQRVTDNWAKTIQNTVGYIARNIKLDLAIKNVQAQIEAAQQGHAKYMELLATLRGKMKLSPDMIAQIEDGSIDVSKLKPKVREMVEEYKKWHDKANDLQDSLADLEQQQRDLAKQKLDNIAQDYGFKIDRIDAQIANAEARRNSKIATGQEITDDDYVADIEANNKKLNVLAEQRAEMQRELNNLVASGMIQQGSEDWHNYTGQIEELDVALLDVKASLGEIQKEIYDLNVAKLNYALDALKHIQETSENLIDNKLASGKKINAADYIPMLAVSEQQIANMEEQIALARKAQEGLDVNSELYQDLESDIRSNESAIWDVQKAQIEWNNAVKDIPLKELQWALDAINAIKSSLEGLRSLNEAQKIEVTKDYYQSLVDNGMAEINNLENQNQLLREKLIGMDVESEKYQEILGQIRSTENAILDVKTAQEQWVDSIVDIRIDRIKKLQEELQKTNDKYERRVELEKALENLEKARQRTKMVYKEGQGFVYQRDEKAFKDAEKALKDVQHKEVLAKMDDAIDALEELKKDNNIYDSGGNLLTPIDWNTMGVNLDAFQQNLMNGLQLGGYAAQLFEQMGLDGGANYASGGNGGRPNVVFTMEDGAIQISGAGDPQLVANAVGNEFLRIMQDMPMYVTQEMNRR